VHFPAGTAVGNGPVTEGRTTGTDVDGRVVVTMAAVVTGTDVVVTSESVDDVEGSVVLGAGVRRGASVSFDESPRPAHAETSAIVRVRAAARITSRDVCIIDTRSGAPFEASTHAVHRQVQSAVDVDTHEAGAR
jgi:hypothetical protein